MIVPTGEPDDWTDKSKVLAEIPDRSAAWSRSPITAPFVSSGATRRMPRTSTPAPASAPVAAGPRGVRRGMPGPVTRWQAPRLRRPHSGRPSLRFRFHSPRRQRWGPGGSDRRAVDVLRSGMATGQPNLHVRHRWLTRGRVLAGDETQRGRTHDRRTDLHDLSRGHRRADLGGSILESAEADIGEFSLPRLKQVIHFHLPTPVLDLTSRQSGEYFCSVMHGDRWVIAQIEPPTHRSHFVGGVRGQSLRTPVFLQDGVAILSSARSEQLIARFGKTDLRVPVGNDITWASRCGDRIIATETKNGPGRTVWLDSKGTIEGSFIDGERTMTPTCSSDGTLIFLATFGPKSGLRRCDRAGCRQIFEGSAGGWLCLPTTGAWRSWDRTIGDTSFAGSQPMVSAAVARSLESIPSVRPPGRTTELFGSRCEKEGR